MSDKRLSAHEVGMVHLSLESFETDRLRAERICDAHVEEICRLHRDPRVMKTLSADGQPMPDEQTQRGLADAVEHWQTRGFGFWIFRDRTDGRFVGRGGLKVYQIDGTDVIGLAYAVDSELWGRGYASEMAQASLAIGFDRLNFPEIGSWTLPINLASQRVMEKLGFRYVGDFTFAGLPHRRYRLLASDWRSRSAGSVS